MAHYGLVSRGKLRKILHLYWNYSYTEKELNES